MGGGFEPPTPFSGYATGIRDCNPGIPAEFSGNWTFCSQDHSLPGAKVPAVAVLGWGRGALAPPLFVQAPQFFHRLVIIAMDDTMFATMCGVAVHHAGVYSCQH